MAQRRPDRVRARSMSRRAFLHLAGAAAGTLAVSCAARIPAERVPVSAPSQPAQPCATPVSPPPVTSRPVTVAIGQADRYDSRLVAQSMRELFDGLGGLGDVVRPGDRVAVKVNLTGGTATEPLRGVPAIESYVTHPEVVRAVGGLLRDAGAAELYIVEAVYEWASYVKWGYVEVARELGATLIDLNAASPYADYTTIPVGEHAFVYPHFTVNPILCDVDVFISIAKMKHHWSCGVTHTLKNLIGLVPARFYRLSPDHLYRSAFHGSEHETPTRLPRIIVDLNRARPIQLAVVDGIKSAQGGEGPWIKTMRPIEPGLLVAGKDAVAVDAVATALMGIDPTVDLGTSPFVRGLNHLNLAYEMGLGTNRLEEIRTVGPPIEEVRCVFDPGWD